MEETAAPDDVRAMARALLADRFKLRVHTDTRELPVASRERRHDHRATDIVVVPSSRPKIESPVSWELGVGRATVVGS